MKMATKHFVEVEEIIQACIAPNNKICAVYVFGDANNCVLYVGKTLNPLERFGRHVKDKDWFTEIETWEVEWCKDEQDALDREAELIKELQPKYNKTFKSNRGSSLKTKRYWQLKTTHEIIRQVKFEMGMDYSDSYMNLSITELQQFVKRRDELLEQRLNVLQKVGHI